MRQRATIWAVSSILLLCALWAASAFVEAQERERAGRGRRGEFRLPTPPVIGAIDVNGDGEITTEEMEKATSALKKLDKDGNGKLTVEEYRGRMRFGPGGPGRR